MSPSSAARIASKYFARLTRLDEVSCPPCERRLSKLRDQQICYQTGVPSVSVLRLQNWEDMILSSYTYAFDFEQQPYPQISLESGIASGGRSEVYSDEAADRSS